MKAFAMIAVQLLNAISFAKPRPVYAKQAECYISGTSGVFALYRGKELITASYQEQGPMEEFKKLYSAGLCARPTKTCDLDVRSGTYKIRIGKIALGTTRSLDEAILILRKLENIGACVRSYN